MYLLKLPDEPDELLSSVFTFHYVSIKTRTPAAQQHRHNKFTFHYVSIKTHSPALISFSCLYLHSTMYLLKQISESKIKTTIVTFTFHYVSIKTH